MSACLWSFTGGASAVGTNTTSISTTPQGMSDGSAVREGEEACEDQSRYSSSSALSGDEYSYRVPEAKWGSLGLGVTASHVSGSRTRIEGGRTALSIRSGSPVASLTSRSFARRSSFREPQPYSGTSTR
jgi:hypothetical protein